MKRNILVGLIAVILIAALAWYVPTMRRAEAGALPDLLALVPGNATFIAYADVDVLRTSPLAAYLGQSLRAVAGPATADRDYASFVSATGFDYQRDLDRVALAAIPGSPEQTFVLAEGRFDRAKIEQYALRSGKAEEIEGRIVYVMPNAGQGKGISVSFLASNRIALVQGGGLTGLLAATGKPGFNSGMRERLLRVAGSPLFAAAKAPANVARTEGNSSGAGLGNTFDAVSWMTFAAQPGGEDVLVSAEGECDTSDHANQIASALEFLRGILHTGLADPKSRGQLSPEMASAADGLLQSVKITSESSRVRLLLSITPAMIRAMGPAGGRIGTPGPR